MSFLSPLPIRASALQAGAPPSITLRRSCYLSWKELFRPCAAGFIGLAIAVALWGFGYKLSLYHRPSAPSSQVPVARFWIDPLDRFETAASSLKAKLHLVPDSQALAAFIQRIRYRGFTVARTLPVWRRQVTYFDLLIPLRGPPPQRFSLA